MSAERFGDVAARMVAETEPTREATRCAACPEVGWWPGDLCYDCVRKQEVERALAYRRSKWTGSLTTLHVPPAYHGVPADLALPAACASWNGEPWSVTILGPTGAGKTWIAIRLLMELYCRGLDGCLFADAPTMLDRVKAEMGGQVDSRSRGIFGAMVSAPALLIDDVSAARDTDYQRDRLVLLLRERYNALRPTIVTSNKATLSELADSLDGPVGSRLAGGIVVAVKGKDRRLT